MGGKTFMLMAGGTGGGGFVARARPSCDLAGQ